MSQTLSVKAVTLSKALDILIIIFCLSTFHSFIFVRVFFVISIFS